MQGEGPDQLFGRPRPVGSRYVYDRGTVRTLWIGIRRHVLCLISGSNKERAVDASKMVVAPMVKGFGTAVDLFASCA